MKTINDFYNNTEKVMLVDGDLLAYKLTSSLEEVIDWGMIIGLYGLISK